MKNPKIKTREIVEGSGRSASGDVWVKARAKIHLNHGDEVPGLWHDEGESGFWIRLNDREIIPGLRSAADGMKVGGVREFTIPPHLAYGERGIEGLIPENAVLKGTIELIEVLPPEEHPIWNMHPDFQDVADVCSLNISAEEEESSPLPRWGMHFITGQTDHCDLYRDKPALYLKWNTILDGKWHERHAIGKSVELQLNAQEIASIIKQAEDIAISHPDECLGLDDLYTYGGHSSHRCRKSDVICWSIRIMRGFQVTSDYHLRRDSPIWTNTEWGRHIMGLVTPHIKPSPALAPIERKLP